MMFYLFSRHHILPGDYYRMSEGDKAVLQAFCQKEWEAR